MKEINENLEENITTSDEKTNKKEIIKLKNVIKELENFKETCEFVIKKIDEDLQELRQTDKNINSEELEKMMKDFNRNTVRCVQSQLNRITNVYSRELSNQERRTKKWKENVDEINGLIDEYNKIIDNDE